MNLKEAIEQAQTPEPEVAQEMCFTEIVNKLSETEFNYIKKIIQQECIVDYSSKIMLEVEKYKHFINMIAEDNGVNLNGYYNLLILVNSVIEKELYEYKFR